MFDEGQHHPKWSFVHGWNERRCTCHTCTPIIQITPYQQFVTVPPQPPQAPQAFWGHRTTTTNSTANGK